MLAVGFALFFAASCSRAGQHRELDELGRIRALLVRARAGARDHARRRAAAATAAGVPVRAAGSASSSRCGRRCEAFHIHQPLAAAGLVLVLINVATIFPLWPGNVGLVQTAVALPLVNYGVAYAHGVAFGIGLQAIEASVGVGVGLIFLAREGLSYATLRDIDDRRPRRSTSERRAGGADRARARVPG